MRRFLAIGAGLLLGLLAIPILTASASSFTVGPWAYACNKTDFGNPVAKQDVPGQGECPAGDKVGNAFALYVGGTLTMGKEGPTTDDLAAGATIGGLVTLSAASFDLGPESYCGAGAPRLNVTTKDGKTHFFGCQANNKDGHVSIDFSAAGDGSKNGGVAPDEEVTAIDFVQDEQGTAVLKNLSFTGNAPPSVNPAPSGTVVPTSAPVPAVGLAQTGDGVIWYMALAVGLVLMVMGGSTFWLSRSRK